MLPALTPASPPDPPLLQSRRPTRRCYSPAVRTELEHVARRWAQLGADDPLWAALTTRRRGGWDWDAFLRSGHAEIDALLDLLARRGLDPARGMALDFGCGPGRLSAGLAAAGFARVLGIDVAPSMIAAARRNVADPRCDFQLNSAADLRNVASGSVDLVYCARVLQHLPPPLAAGYLREFLRVVAPAGVVAFQLPSGPRGPAGHAARLLPARVRDRLRHGMQMHGAPPDTVARVVADAGGVTVSVEDDQLAGPHWHSHLYLARPRRVEPGPPLAGRAGTGAA